jgi:hypothetical protein
MMVWIPLLFGDLKCPRDKLILLSSNKLGMAFLARRKRNGEI